MSVRIQQVNTVGLYTCRDVMNFTQPDLHVFKAYFHYIPVYQLPTESNSEKHFCFNLEFLECKAFKKTGLGMSLGDHFFPPVCSQCPYLMHIRPWTAQLCFVETTAWIPAVWFSSSLASRLYFTPNLKTFSLTNSNLILIKSLTNVICTVLN